MSRCDYTWGAKPLKPPLKEVPAPVPTVIELVRQARAGHREAFSILYERYKQTVTMLLLSKVGHREDALDLMQESFLIGYQRLGTLNDNEKFGAWICGIASHLGINHVQRRRGREKPLHPETAELAAPPPSALSETGKAVWTAIHSLPERYHLPLLLRYVEGLGAMEISDKTDLTYGSTRVVLSEGTRLLRDKLRPLLSSD